jgi:hypothetical protein
MRLVLMAVAAAAFQRVSAQADTTKTEIGATISGAVHDSVAHTPLRDALVQLVSGDFVRTATTDARGAFLFREIPMGRYTIGFLHPVLDSIGIEGPLRELTIDAKRAFIVNLAVPSPARIRSAICKSPATGDSGAVIIGIVRDASTDRVASGVGVRGEWLEYVLTRGGMSRRLGHRDVISAANGWYALCNVPNSGIVALTGSRGADTTGSVEVQIPSDGFARRDMYIGTLELERVDHLRQPKPVASGSISSRPQKRMRVGNGRVSGKVVSVAGGVPLINAQVAIVDGPATRTNDLGEFLLTNAPQGTQMIEVRALGYYPHRRQIDVISGAGPANISLSTLQAVLDTVKVIAKRLPAGPDDGGFARRRRMGFGKFISPADMARHPVINTADVFRRYPGMRTDAGKILMRGVFSSQLGGESWCEASIFINGMNMSFMSIEDINDWVPPHLVAGIEVYSESNVPPQFQVGLSGCGSVVIWMK